MIDANLRAMWLASRIAPLPMRKHSLRIGRLIA
jgi:hypothetical protein